MHLNNINNIKMSEKRIKMLMKLNIVINHFKALEL